VLFSDFDPALRPRLDELSTSATTTDRVVSALTEVLLAGKSDVTEVAGRLGLSARSLQRRLLGEGTRFNAVLQSLRTKLARHYLAVPELSNSQIASLLAYDDPNSFIRAFHGWTGTTPEAYRRVMQEE